MPSRDQPQDYMSKSFSRHYHKIAPTTIPIDSKSRREIEILRRRNRHRLMKWCAIGLLLTSLALAYMLYMSKSH
jgi:hypothetical protein